MFDNKLDDPVIQQLYENVGEKCFGESFGTRKRCQSGVTEKGEQPNDEPFFGFQRVKKEKMENDPIDSAPLSSIAELKLDNDEMIFNIW